ncbi:hypothetical protein F4782DRAFT_501974 [Xylaria castorea]|nr:hypothetical protein F4782DRAFT_501974 [Xylaria castorea]
MRHFCWIVSLVGCLASYVRWYTVLPPSLSSSSSSLLLWSVALLRLPTVWQPSQQTVEGVLPASEVDPRSASRCLLRKNVLRYKHPHTMLP